MPFIKENGLLLYLNSFDVIKSISENYKLEILIFLKNLTPTLNPRKIKKVINLYTLITNILEVGNIELYKRIIDNSELKVIILELSILYFQNKEIYDEIVNFIGDRGNKLSYKFDKYKNTVIYNYVVKKYVDLKSIIYTFGVGYQNELLSINDYLNLLKNSNTFDEANDNINNLLSFLGNKDITANYSHIVNFFKIIVENKSTIYNKNQILGNIEFDSKLSKIVEILFEKLGNTYNIEIKKFLENKLSNISKSSNPSLYATINEIINKIEEALRAEDEEIPF